MSKITKGILTILVMAAVMAYTVINYLTGKIAFDLMVVSLVILALPMFNMIRLLIQELKQK